MSTIDLLTKLTSNNIRIQDKADQCGVQKQTFYNYIKYFENGNLIKVPEVVRDYFIIVMDEKRRECAIEDAEKFWDSKFQLLNASKMKLAKQDKETEMIDSRIKTIESELGPGYDFSSNPEDDKLFAEMKSLEEQRMRILREKEVIENEIKSTLDDLMKKSVPRVPENENEMLIGEAMSFSPPWDVSSDLLESFSTCNNNTGECVIFYNHEDTPAKAEIFAAIGGSLVKIATYRNKENENFISFKLFGKLDYFYKLTVYSEGGPFSSDMLKL